MLPYIQAPRMTATVLVAAAILIGHFLLIRRARQAGLDTGTAAGFSASMLACGLVFGHLVKLFYVPTVWDAVQSSPALLLRIFSGQASFGGLLGGLLGGLAYLRWRGASLEATLQWFDQIALVFPYAWILGRAHCVVVHDHPGIRTTSWLGVVYPDGARFDLAVLEILFLLAVIAAYVPLRRHHWSAGFYCGVFLVAYGAFRFMLDQLHVDVVRYFGWSVDQWASGFAFLAGVGFLTAGRASTKRVDAPAFGGISEVIHD